MAFPKTIRNFNVFVDGVSYFGRATEGTLPQPTIQTAAHRGAGMDAPIGIDLGMEGMTAEITLAEWDPALLKKIGRQERFVFRPVAKAEDDETVTGFIATVGGLVTKPEVGTLQGGNLATLKLMLDVRYYKLEVDGEEIWEIDIENGVRRVDGVDQLADIRRAMGI